VQAFIDLNNKWGCLIELQALRILVILPSYELGVSCVYCIDKTSDVQKAGFRMRQSQIAAAKRKRL
jgi:hypothetical protein